ncbi:unnamed protein product [Rotaria sp. Silwood1]|nr:unnamed protein product [Rotaria sp. Silwood1]
MSKSSKTVDPNQISRDLFTTLTNLHQEILKHESNTNNNPIDPKILSCIESVLTSLKSLRYIESPKTLSDIIHTIWKIYITDFLSLIEYVNILVSDQFQQIFNCVMKVYATINFQSIFRDDTLYAHDKFFRIFELLSLPSIINFLKNQSNNEIMSHIANILRMLLLQMQNIEEEICFKKDDLLNQESIIQLLFEYVDMNLIETNNDIQLTIIEILEFIWTLVDNTILIPQLLNTNCVSFTLKWINMCELPFTIQRASIRLLYNIARHEKGCNALNEADALRLLKEFKQRTLDTTINDTNYEDMRLLFSMALALLTEPKESKSDAKSLGKVLDQLMQMTVNTAQRKNHKYGDFDISEPLVVFIKLFIHDDILHYCIKESQVKNMKVSSKIVFFCDLVMQFRGALAKDDELDQLTLTALMNIIWSISFHDEYIDELKSNAKFLITIKSLANDDGEAWVEQYVPKHMSSVKKAAAGILWNLDENNPARTICVAESTPIVADQTNRSSTAAVKDIRMRVMVSYSHADSDFCHQLVDALGKENLFDIWVDFAYCHTEDLWEEIGQAIEKSDIILFLMTKDYQNSKSCRQEVMYAKDSLKKKFIPVYVARDFVASGWLGVRIVGPQYIRFGKKPFEATIKELVKLIFEDKGEKNSKSKDSKPAEIKPNENDKLNQELLKDDHEKFNQSNGEITQVSVRNSKSIKKWNSKDIIDWFDANKIRHELKEIYDFQCGTELLLYGQCLRPDWQSEYLDIREQFSKRYNTPLYRNEFVRLVTSINQLEELQTKPVSSTCTIL